MKPKKPMKSHTLNILKTALVTAAVGLCLMTVPTQLHADTFGSGANQFIIDFVPVDNPGNPDDSGTTGSDFSPYGGVAYAFRMGTYEISRDMITKANAAGGLGLTLADMTSYGGNIGTHPATGISWNEAARFVNWLNVNSGFAPAYKFGLQPGDAGYSANADISLWGTGDAGYDPNNLYRNSNALYFLPSEDEWYKAAYYSGSGSTYYDYATLQDAPNAPTPVASGTASGTAVYDQTWTQGPANIALAGGMSYYGTLGQNGNVWEWNESALDGVNNSTTEYRGLRGGDWMSPEFALPSSFRYSNVPSSQSDAIGFRVASVPVPEPSSGLLVLMSLSACWLKWRSKSSL
jgi:formylglycine-generating enzyme